jgi:2-C-methyl-D-erythritol 4-phosphate cytidylyltransferase
MIDEHVLSRPFTLTSAPRYWALVPCAGTGTRAGTEQPKQYREVAGQALVLHTLKAFALVDAISATLLLLAPDDAVFETLTGGPQTCLVAHCGAHSRAGTVANGLTALLAQGAGEMDWVLVHDAARCLITPELIQKLIDACRHDDVGGLLAQPLPDTLKAGDSDGRVTATLTRPDKWLAQTPQMFRIGALRKALAVAGNAVTDESSAMETVGLRPRLVAGSAQNFKVTYPEDFELAEAVLMARRNKGRA